MTDLPRTIACFTFDNMGEAADIGAGEITGPRDVDPSVTVGYPRILDMLDRHEVKSTFFLEGWNGIHHPKQVSQVAQSGHELGMHGWVHEQWSALDPVTERRLASESTDALAQAAGVPIVGFRAPGGERSAHTEEILLSLGYEYDASLGDKMTPQLLDSGLAQVPFVWPGVDGYYYLRDEPVEPVEVEQRWRRALDRSIDEGGIFLLIAHAFISGIDVDRLAVLDRIIESAVADDRVVVMTAGEIAEVVRGGSESR